MFIEDPTLILGIAVAVSGAVAAICRSMIKRCRQPSANVNILPGVEPVPDIERPQIPATVI